MSEAVNTNTSVQSATDAPKKAREQLCDAIGAIIAPLGYEVVDIEVVAGRQKVLRLFIDKPTAGDGSRGSAGTPAITIEDCVRVTKHLDQPLETLPQVDAVFKGSYELEVSSPGIFRPLRRSTDFERYKGSEARIHVFRPLTASELGNAVYQGKNPRQKNFLGKLAGLTRDGDVQSVLLDVPVSSKAVEVVAIPISLISKANLEPNLEIPNSSQKGAE